jgi:hypothetical protein
MGVKIFKLAGTHLGDDPEKDTATATAWPKLPIGWDQYRTVQVELDDDAQRWIGHLDEETFFTLRNFSVVNLELRSQADGTIDVGVSGRRAGVLRHPDADIFRPLFAGSGGRDEVLTARGSRYHAPEGDWRLYVSPPGATYERFRRMRDRFSGPQ